MSITTNRLKIEFNIDAIARDFAFLCFTREIKGGWLGARQLDSLLGDKYRAHAVMFQYGRFAFAMFKRPVDTFKLIAEIRKDPDYENDVVVEAAPKALRCDDVCICEAWLAQILVNSLSSSRSRFEQFHFSNLTGSLLLVPNLTGGRKDFIDISRVTITPDYLLCVNTVRHRKLISLLADKSVKNHGLGARPRYVLHEGTSTLRRWLDDPMKADTKKTYVPHGFKSKKATTPFLDFKSLDAFESSRAGVTRQVLSSIKEKLSEYMTVECCPVDEYREIELSETILKQPKHLHSRLDGIELKIVDVVQDEESASLARAVKEGVAPYLPDNKMLSVGKRDKAGALNLRIIRSPEYYEASGEEDKYLPSTQDTQRQHITMESLSGYSAAAIKTIIKELLIKKDIGSGQLSLFDWKTIQAKDTWAFGIQDEKSSKIVFMDIDPSGEISFREIDGGCLFGHNEYQEYCELISAAKGSEWKTGLTLEGLVVSGDGQKNLIYRTNEITLPDLDKLRSLIEEVSGGLPVGLKTGVELASFVEHAAKKIEGADTPFVGSLVAELKKFGAAEVPKDVFRRTINDFLGKNTKIASALRKFLIAEKGVRLSFPKQKDSLNELFDASLNIKYFETSEREASYFVGERRESIQHSFKSACIVRKIVAAEDSGLIFEEILPTMNVDFVRTGQSTVLPFPFKYIREYLKLV